MSREIKKPEKKGKYEGVEEPMMISSLYVWNKYNEGYDKAIDDYEKYLSLYTPQIDQEELEKVLNEALDHFGYEVRVWKDYYFGRRSEKEIVEKITKFITQNSSRIIKWT